MNKFKKIFQMMYSRNFIITLVAVATLVSIVQIQQIFALPQHTMARRSTFFDIECKGVYNKSIFFRLDRVCDDCYSLFREPQLHTLCKNQCFTTMYFKGCLDALHLNDEIEDIKQYIKLLNGADPNSIVE
uniref:CSON007572 protein n=1 Tax=Culicoides sonorensis TaxID=179676 RepID=A0A336LXM0_CULSO